jgi:hypothetical protein
MLFTRAAAAACFLAGALVASNVSAAALRAVAGGSGPIELSSQKKPVSAIVKQKPIQKKIGARAPRPSPKLNPQPEPPSRPSGMR